MSKRKLMETVADISYIAGTKNYFTGDSRANISEFIFLAQQFEKAHKGTNWNEVDYISAVENFTREQLQMNS